MRIDYHWQDICLRIRFNVDVHDDANYPRLAVDQYDVIDDDGADDVVSDADIFVLLVDVVVAVVVLLFTFNL